MSNKLISLKYLHDLLCKYDIKDLEDLENRFKSVADLEAKLAEKEKAIENWQTMYESVMQTCHNDKEEIERLREQLAEKEKKIDEYKLYIESFKHSQDLDKKYILKLESDLAEQCRLLKTNETLLSGTKIIEKEINQDKISFALEQLEKVKEFVDNLDTPCVESICNEYMCDIEDYIDNQIKQLKEGK